MAPHTNVVCVSIILCMFCLAVPAQWNTKDFLRREHTLTKPYQNAGGSSQLWDFLGSTLVTNNYIRLTTDHQSRRGALWNNVPCLTQNWEIHVQFSVHGQGKNLFGDGIALWYTKERMTLGDVFGSVQPFTGLAVFLDTYSNHNGPHNHQHPYISAMVNNGTLMYDHDTDGTHTQLDGCEAQFRNRKHDTHVAIRYEDETLKVSTDIENKNGWKECFTVQGVRLPVGYYFGASAATGDLADNHDIISVKFYELDLPDEDKKLPYTGLPEAQFFAAPRDRIDDVKGSYLIGSMTGWKLFVIILLILIGIAICGVVGFIVFQKQQESSRKRFY